MNQENNPESVAAVSVLQRTLNLVTRTLNDATLDDAEANELLQDSLISIGVELSNGSAIEAFNLFRSLSNSIGLPFLKSEIHKMAELNSKDDNLNEMAYLRYKAFAELHAERRQLFENHLTPLSEGLISLATKEALRSK